MRKQITISDFAIMFHNKNKQMKLKGHLHMALVDLCFEHTGKTGFPAFANTYADIQSELVKLTARPFMDSTNEDIAEVIFRHFECLDYKKFGWRFETDFKLESIVLKVRGVPDDIGHADGFTSYKVQRC